LGGDELGRRALERFAISGRLACGRNCGKQRHGADAHAAIGISEQWRNQWPDLRGGGVCEHVKRADPYHRIGGDHPKQGRRIGLGRRLREMLGMLGAAARRGLRRATMW
jgi:hypothetical protein